MNLKFLIISIVITSGFVGSAFAQTMSVEKEFSQEEIDEMKHTAVYIGMSEGSFLIELFPEDAPNTVDRFLKLVESGYYDGTVFHRIIPGFMIQGGDPNTKGSDRSFWGQGDPGYTINEEFNTIQHDRGIVSMARGNDPNSAGSQFFIVHQDSNFLDGEYTAFGRLLPVALHPTLPGSFQTLDMIANLETDKRDAPLDVTKATIVEASIAKDFVITNFAGPDRNESIIKKIRIAGGITENYVNYSHNISFDLPLRWEVQDGSEDYLMLVLQPTADEHNIQPQIEKSGFVPQVIILSEEVTPIDLEAGVSTAFFLIKGADEPKVSANYIFENDDGVKAHLVVGTQELPIPGTTETEQFKIIQIHFMNSELSYSIIHVNLTEWFRYEINAFGQTVKNFEVMFDGKMQPINFYQNPVFQQVITDAKVKPEPEPLPPARIGGCLIATASYGSELAPQVQQLRELRDNTILQTESGSAFMVGFNQFYYSFSPAISDYERENPAFKEVVKLVITPLLTSLTLLQYADIDSEYEMLGYGISVILLNIGMYFIAPAVLITKIRSFYKLQ